MIKKIFLLVLFLIISTPFLIAQKSTKVVKAKIVSSKEQAVEFGNIIALAYKDSSIIKGAPFENGIGLLEGLTSDTVLVKIMSVGYADYIQQIVIADSVYDLGKIILKDEIALGEVTVKAKLPMFEVDGEKVRVNVESTTLSTAGNALDVLRRSPSVMVSSTDNVSVFGKGNAIIYLDGMLISSVDILKSIPSSDIKRIEIIRNPSARYDAAGRAVINIITIRNSVQGFNGNFIQNTLYIKELFAYSGIRFNYTKGKWSLSSGYGTNYGNQWSSDNYKRFYNMNDSTKMQLNNAIYDIQRFSKVHYYRVGANYRPDSTSNLGLQYAGYYDLKRNISDNQNQVLQNDDEQYLLKTKTQNTPVTINNSINANYSKQLDTLGTELFMAAQYGSFGIKNTSTIFQETFANGSIIQQDKRNTNSNNIQIISAQVDFTKAFNSKWKLELGLKESNIQKASDIKFENFVSGSGYVSDPTYLNGFSFSENIGALYSQLKFMKNKFNARAGVRAEHTFSDGFSKTLNQQVIDRKYINVFPNAYLGYDFTKDLNTSLTFTSRITRPTFQDLDPFVNYIDNLTSFRGNPYLLPSITNSVEASLVYMKEANLTLGYSNTLRPISLVVNKLSDSTDAFTAVSMNLKNSETFSFGITIPYEIKWWTTANYFGYFLNNFQYQQNGVLVKNSKPTFSIYLYDEFRFKKYFSMELTYEYTSSAVDGIFSSMPFAQFNVTIKKNFFKDKLTCRFVANDLFKQYIMQGTSNIPLYNIDYRSKMSTHYYMLALNYKFGKLKNSNYKNRTVSDDEFNRVKTGK